MAALDEAQSVDGARLVGPIAGRGALGGRQEPGALVVADRVGGDTDGLGQLGDSQPVTLGGSGAHEYDGKPWSVLQGQARARRWQSRCCG